MIERASVKQPITKSAHSPCSVITFFLSFWPGEVEELLQGHGPISVSVEGIHEGPHLGRLHRHTHVSAAGVRGGSWG